MRRTELASNLYVLKGAVNTGVLARNGEAILFDCCDSVTPARLRSLGVKRVAMICCTQHRRLNVSGAYAFAEKGAAIVAPKAERRWFEDTNAYWRDWRNRWHIYRAQPGPLMLTKPLPVSREVSEGDRIEWNGCTIRVIETPGATDGSVSYLVVTDEKTSCFSGDVLCGPGKIWELYSLQKGFGIVGDYHGFLGNRPALCSSLHKIAASGAQVIVPSHGEPFENSQEAAVLLEGRLNELWRNYTAISALNHYFPSLLDETKDDPLRMKPARTFEPPSWIHRVAATSFAVISETGAAFLIDCGAESVTGRLRSWISEKAITSVDGCWITHYHDDHVDALQHLFMEFNCPVMTDRHMAEIIEHPSRFFLPCISPVAVPVARATKDGETWSWHEFQFTAYHFPGQTLYHGGLLVEGHGAKVFFAGDSGAPTGLDDYTCGNRVFLGADRGSRKCLALWRELQPDYIFNAHQDRAFAFSPEELDYMDRLLAERERLIADMTPWENANFATDEWWVRTYPYEQEAAPGSTISIDIEFTNHGPNAAEAKVEPILPDGWKWKRATHDATVTLPPHTDGVARPFSPQPDRAARIWIKVANDAVPERHVIPFRISLNGRYLGPFRHALVEVR